MPDHFVHFNKREVVLNYPDDAKDPWFSELQPVSSGFENPVYHVTQAVDGVAATVKPGDTIWLFAQMRTPWGPLPPALDARIDVRKVIKRIGGDPKKKGFRYIATESSRWFDYKDVTRWLDLLRTKSRAGEGRVRHDDKVTIGKSLRKMRKLVSGKPLEEWERRLDQMAGKLHFISYRLCDGTEGAYGKALDLANKGNVFFWDRWSLPRRMAERREVLASSALDSRIESVIRKAEYVWGIESLCYGAEGSYSLLEQKLAKKLQKYRRVATVAQTWTIR